MKAALVWDGVDPNSFRGPAGNDLPALAARMAAARSHRDDAHVQAVIANLPPYAASRYKPAGLKRLPVVKLARSAQFTATSSARIVGTADLAAQMEADEWPGPRTAFTL